MNEFQIFQNKLLGAHLIWEFSKFYEDHHVARLHPDIFCLLPVLPICLNTRAVKAIKDRRYKQGSLYKVLEEQRDLFSGLQQRMENMAPLTLESIYIASATGLIEFDPSAFTVIPNRNRIPEKVDKSLTSDYQGLLQTSRRLGAWFSSMSIPEISLHFNITI